MRIATAVLALIAFGAGAGISGAQGKIEAEFKPLIDRYYAAWNTLNPDNAAPFYAKDADLVFYDIAPLKYTGWAEYDKGVRQVLATFTSLKLTVKNDLKATRRGNLAWTTVTFNIAGTPKQGQPVNMDGRHTVIWERRGKEWLIVHEHVSAPLP